MYGSLRRIGSWIIRLAAVGGMALAALALYVDLTSWDITRLAESLGGGKVLAPEAASRFIDEAPALTAMRHCRRDVLLAAGRLAAASVDAVISAGDVARVEPAIAWLERMARRILDCSPGESIAWTWMAMARNQKAGNDDEVKSLFERSQWTGPSDLGVIEIRLPEISRALSRRGPTFVPLARADIRTLFLAEHNAWDSARILGSIFQWIGPIAQEEFEAVVADPIRREALVQAFGWQRANLAGCSRERFIDWLYRGQRGSCMTGDKIPNFDWQTPVERRN